ncbi:MAG: AtpZ/AtpI family protein [Candidatus Taylorbacteria bacterium]|nr:AtpZ/AtpI family protein [Candidatus Taylorbacteria bacterium]
MQEPTGKEAWWKPGLDMFGKISVWVVVPIVLALICGKYLDARFDTKPWIFIGLSAIGFGISSFGIVHTALSYLRTEKKKNDDTTNPNQ